MERRGLQIPGVFRCERTVELEVRGDLAGVVSVRLDAPDGAELTRVELVPGEG